MTTAPRQDARSTLEAFTRCWLDAQPLLRSYVRGAIQSEADVDDVVQDAAQRIAGSFEGFDLDRPFLPWALVITRSAVIDYFRRQGRERHQFGTEALEAVASSYQRLQVELDIDRRNISGCLEALPPRWAEMIQLRYGNDVPPRHIASQMRMSPEAVRTALARIRRRLADCLEQHRSEGVR